MLRRLEKGTQRIQGVCNFASCLNHAINFQADTALAIVQRIARCGVNLTAAGALRHLTQLLFPILKTLAKTPATATPQELLRLLSVLTPPTSLFPRTPTSPTTPAATTDAFLS